MEHIKSILASLYVTQQSRCDLLVASTSSRMERRRALLIAGVRVSASEEQIAHQTQLPPENRGVEGVVAIDRIQVVDIRPRSKKLSRHD